jgi:hypothetical protein
MLQLAGAADYFQLPGLFEAVADWAMYYLEEDIHLAWRFLVVSDGVIGSGMDDTTIHRAAMQIVGEAFFHDLMPQSYGDIQGVSSHFLEKFLCNKNVVAKEFHLFGLIQEWHDAGKGSGKPATDKEEESVDEGGESGTATKRTSKVCGAPQEAVDGGSTTEDSPNAKRQKMDSFFGGVILGDERTKTATAIIEKNIHLGHIAPSDLRDIVEPSGLVSSDAISEAYKAHAHRYGEITPVAFAQKSRGPVWIRFAGRSYGEVLMCNPMQSGVYIWSIKVSNPRKGKFWLGIADNSPREPCTFVWGSTGQTHLESRTQTVKVTAADSGLPTYSTGDTITFRLDLSTRAGILWAKVGTTAEEVLLVENLLMEGEEKVDRTFAPLAHFKQPAEVQFVNTLEATGCIYDLF